MMRTSVLRAAQKSLRPQTTQRVTLGIQQLRYAHAISNPTLANIEQRWTSMPPQEQADLWMQLRDRMKNDWTELTQAEKKAAYWIAFGAHGPRAEAPPGEGWRIIAYTTGFTLIAFALFGFTRLFARGPPKTMSQEWQEATNEYMKENNMEPITGISSVGYVGKGQVQSPPVGKSAEELAAGEDDE